MIDKPDDYTKEPKSVWRIESVSAHNYGLDEHERDWLLSDGWEPFAVDDGKMYFRKRVVVSL